MVVSWVFRCRAVKVLLHAEAPLQGHVSDAFESSSKASERLARRQVLLSSQRVVFVATEGGRSGPCPAITFLRLPSMVASPTCLAITRLGDKASLLATFTPRKCLSCAPECCNTGAMVAEGVRQRALARCSKRRQASFTTSIRGELVFVRNFDHLELRVGDMRWSSEGEGEGKGREQVERA